MCVVDNMSRRSSFNDSDEAAALFKTLSKTMNDDDCGESYHNIVSDVSDEVSVPLTEAIKTQQKHCVQHNYHDHSSDRDHTSSDDKMMAASNKGGVTVPFPLKLWDMLDHVEKTEPELTEIISWQPHGRCFLVHKPQEFAKNVLTKFFQQKKYASFQRQLNLYGFKRITKGPDRGSYYHELFLKGKQFLCHGIARLKIKGTGARMPSNPDAEPNFYSMTPIPKQSDQACNESDQDIENWTSTNAIYHNIGSVRPAHIPSAQPTARRSHKSIMQRRFREMHQTMPPLPSVAISQPVYQQEESPQNPLVRQQDHLDFVFDNMPFHSIADSPFQETKRRHSLMLPQNRRTTIIKDLARRNSLVGNSHVPQDSTNDDILDNEMDLILSLGDSDITEIEMIDVFDKIV